MKYGYILIQVGYQIKSKVFIKINNSNIKQAQYINNDPKFEEKKIILA